MEKPRPEKVAVVEEVRGRLDGASAAVLTEYRGLSVSEMAALRRSLSAAGADYKVYKNTLVRLAIAGGPHESIEQLLTGPTAIAFVSGEISAVAKALRDYARTNPSLVIKGGLYAQGFLSAQDLTTLADLPPREVLLARVAGGLAAPMRQLAGLLEALPRNLAYGLSALLEQRGGTPLESGPGTSPGGTSPEPSSSEGPAAEPAPEQAAAAGDQPVAAEEAAGEQPAADRPSEAAESGSSGGETHEDAAAGEGDQAE